MKLRLKMIQVMSFLGGILLVGGAFWGGVSGCGSAATGGGGGGGGGTPSGGVVDENGNAITAVDTNDPVNLQLSGLTANTQYHVAVTAPDGTALSPSGGFIATADEDGAIPSSTVVQDLSTTGGAALVLNGGGIVPRIKAQVGGYHIVVTDDAGNVIISPDFNVEDRAKVACVDSAGTETASFTSSTAVFAKIDKGSSTLADGTYTCHVLPDLNQQLASGDPIGGTTFSVTVAGGTGLGSLGTWPAGAYDVVCDINANGNFDPGTDLISRSQRFHPCFTIQSANTAGDIIGQICSDQGGNYRDFFDPNASADTNGRNVFAWIAPNEQSLVQHTLYVRKYVVVHKSAWSDGDVLTDVTGCTGGEATEADPVQGFCTNEAPWLVWPRQCLVAGCYDCIIDVNHDGLYTKGTDFLDNKFNDGDNALGGMCVTSSACSETLTITSPADLASVDATAVTITGTVTGTATQGEVIVTHEQSSQSVGITITGGAFSVPLPLFHGENHVTVVTFNSDGTFCGKTITVTSTSTASTNQLFRVQLTWDGSTDMDLHLVNPGDAGGPGVYSNGGGGTTDCNFANCQVGLDGSGTNTIDWGTGGSEDDDPKLDVDCVACGNGIENIWMNEINQDGVYKIYVDAFSGDETGNVTVTVFIGSAQVGLVNCGPMSSGTATDSCFAGTITWSGGSSGSGFFAVDGAKATTF